jgi:phosphoserine phosphatase
MEVSDLKILSPISVQQADLALAFTPSNNSQLAQFSDNLPLIASWNIGRYQVMLATKHNIQAFSERLHDAQIDSVCLAELPDFNQPGLALFDMDSTLIEIECIDEIAKLAGVGDEVSQVTERAMQGELDFEQSLRQRVGKLAGANESILEEVRARLPLMAEAELLILGLKSMNWKVAVASGGFTYFSDHLKTLLALDYAKSNRLEIVGGQLTGQVLGGVVSAQTKSDILLELAAQYQIPIQNTLAVGDGANDLIMLKSSGLGVAYHAKPKVVEQAQAAVNYCDLGGVLCILSASVVLQNLNSIT